jgi:signal transduction histidine kinase
MLLSAVALIALRRERLGARSRRAEAMQQLALGLRHEINNALASVMLNAELLAEEDGLDAEQRSRLVAIVEQSRRMRNVLRKLEKAEHFDVVVPYLNEGYMVDLSTTAEGTPTSEQPV